MGTWGMRSFENDSASDWVFDLVERDSPGYLTETLDVAQVEYLEGPNGEAIVAASEVVLALAGDPSDDLPEEVQAWVAGRSDVVAGAYRSLALEALDRVLGADSELLDLWTEAGGDDLQTWRANLESLRNRVSEIPESSEPPFPAETRPRRPQLKRPWWKFWA